MEATHPAVSSTSTVPLEHEKPLTNLPPDAYKKSEGIYEALFAKARQLSISPEGKLSKEEMESFHQFAMLSLAKLKMLNRELHINIANERKELDSAKTTMEKLQLSYENLLYEKSYLQREIEQCRDLRTPHLDEIAKERGHRVETLEYREEIDALHAVALAELESERQERLAMKRILEEKEESAKALNAAIDKKRRFVDDLPQKIAHIRGTTMELSRQFDEVLPTESSVENTVEEEEEEAESERRTPSAETETETENAAMEEV